MLTSLVISLQARTSARLPASLGRASQAVLLRLIEQRNPALAEHLHSGEGLRPYTASNLVLGKRQKGELFISAGQEGWLRFTGISIPVSNVLQAIASEPPPSLAILDHDFTVTAATLNPAEHPWANQTSYQDLAAPNLLGGISNMATQVGLEFANPTTFRSRERMVPLPVPELVFGSLLDHWQAFAPIPLHPDMRRFVEEAVALGRFNIQSHSVSQKEGGLRVGFTGQAAFVALDKDRYWLNMLHLLAAFSFYSGVGYQTTAGMGQVRPHKTARR